MNRFILILSLLVLCRLPASAADLVGSLRTAEKFHAEKSFSRALKIYQSLVPGEIPEAERGFVEFRIHDCAWRAEAATNQTDPTRISAAREALERMVRDVRGDAAKDRVWAEVHESLGDFHWMSRRSRNWGRAWQHYSAAMDWWGGARDVALARERYMAIVRRIVVPTESVPHYHYGYFGNHLPLETARDILRIAASGEDRAYASYIMAMTARQMGGNELRARAADYFEAALKIGKRAGWYDDALWFYAQWMESQGRIVPVEGGGWRHEPDAAAALKLYQRLLREFRAGESRHHRAAQARARQITAESLNVNVANVFVPGSLVRYHLHWRNLREIRLALYSVDLDRDLKADLWSKDRGGWLSAIDLTGRQAVREWSHDTGDKGDHQPGSQVLELDGKLSPGAYVLTAVGGGRRERELVLVTDSVVLLKTNGGQALAWFCDAVSGEPKPDADVAISLRWREGREFRSSRLTGKTDPDGLARFDLSMVQGRNPQMLVAARLGEQQAFAEGNTYFRGAVRQSWKLHVYADRPAYRPGEQLSWKVIARTHDGGGYATPAGETVNYEIASSQGVKLAAGELKLNGFGSAWAEQELGADLPLGEYRVRFRVGGRNVGQATLFRLEEYKLPEFQVKVTTPEENGRRKLFRLGDEVEAEVRADYYSGGPVAGAKVEVIVRQSPHYHHWPVPREFPWFFEDVDGRFPSWGRPGRGNEVLRETLTTDVDGRVRVRFETPVGGGQDYEYAIEARVTDRSRREIVGSDKVRVTRQRYAVNARSERHVWRPGDRVVVGFESKDANGNAHSVVGEVTVTRQTWREVWRAPDGRDVFGDALSRLQLAGPFPPPAPPGGMPWRRKFSGYEREEIVKRKIQLDGEGRAELDFDPGREGWYRVEWRSEDLIREEPRLAQAVTAETAVWVASGKTSELGYRSGGIQIVADKDTFRVGEKAAVMLLAASNRRFVLFSTEGEDLYSHRVVRMDGRVKLLTLDITEREVPNFFLNAQIVMDRQVHQDSLQVVVPPTRNFITVEVETDKSRYQPREKGAVRITTRDDQGRPVPAEVSLGLVDESVYYIQEEYAGDPRQFFFGQKRGNHSRNRSTFNWRAYRLLSDDEKEGADREGAMAQERQAGQGGERMLMMRGAIADAPMESPEPAAMAIDAMEVAAAPMAAAPTSARRALMKQAEGVAPADEVRVHVRNDFRSTIAWMPALKTGQDGRADVEITYPDSLTGWKASVRAVSRANQFGQGSATTRTRQPLIVRLQAPRFLVVGDDAVVSAVVNNNTDLPQKVAIKAEFSGLPKLEDLSEQTLEIPAGGDRRVDWKVSPKVAGELRVRVTGRSRDHADAMEKTYPVHDHGIDKLVVRSGKVRGENVRLRLDLPAERDVDSTTMKVRVAPSLAVTMLDALPYLISYPYGCTEQTMSRFLPTAITLQTLKNSGLRVGDVAGRLFGGIEAAHVAKTQPDGAKDLDQASAMVRRGLERLYEYQHGDGGWGWWKEGDSDHWMTGYVLWGLSLAKQLPEGVREEALRKAAGFLDQRLVEAERAPDLQAWMLHALAVYRARSEGVEFSEFQRRAFANLMEQRERLNACSRALLALAAHHFGQAREARVLVRNLENGVIEDRRPDVSMLVGGARRPEGLLGTAHWGSDAFRRWSDGDVETTALVLQALVTIQPEHRLVEPTVNWLLKNRRGAQWNNTRDTAMVILALNDYLRVTGELQPDLEYEVLVNGRSVAQRSVVGAEVFRSPTVIDVPGELIRDGNNDVEIRRSGEGPIYFAVETRYFSREEPVAPVGSEVFVRREYFRLVGRPTLLKGQVFDRVKLADGEEVRSGERIETVLTVEAKNNYEYLLFEDLKPAGFEAVEVRSGGAFYAKELTVGEEDGLRPVAKERRRRETGLIRAPEPPAIPGGGGRSRWVHRELRDRKVALFIDQLPQGRWEMRYELRAETPGRFHAMPVLGQAMYVPEVRCNGAEIRVTVTD